MHIREAVVLSQREEYAGRAAALPLAAEAAVANASTGGALPLLPRKKTKPKQTQIENSDPTINDLVFDTRRKNPRNSPGSEKTSYKCCASVI